MYSFYIDDVLLPIAPAKLTMKINNANKTYTMIDGGEVNILKDAKLTDIDFEILLPNVQYPFAEYEGGFHPASYFLEKLEELKVNKAPFQFIVVRTLPNGDPLWDTNMTVSLEDYKYVEDAKNGTDVTVSIKLKQYRKYGTKALKVTKTTSEKVSVTKSKPRSKSNNAPSNKLPMTYAIKSGDTLWSLAKMYYGDGSKYTLIVKANSSIKNPNLIYVGQKITIPKG